MNAERIAVTKVKKEKSKYSRWREVSGKDVEDD